MKMHIKYKQQAYEHKHSSIPTFVCARSFQLFNNRWIYILIKPDKSLLFYPVVFAREQEVKVAGNVPQVSNNVGEIMSSHSKFVMSSFVTQQRSMI